MEVSITKKYEEWPDDGIFVFYAQAKVKIVHEIAQGLDYDIYSTILNTPWDVRVHV